VTGRDLLPGNHVLGSKLLPTKHRAKAASERQVAGTPLK
jgi:hypothetical protein